MRDEAGAGKLAGTSLLGLAGESRASKRLDVFIEVGA
jgi:hypothetical protein